VVFTKAVFFDGITMFPGAIAFIGFPAILGEFIMELTHVFIPPGLCKDAGGCNRGEDGVSPDDATVRGTPVADEAVPVDQQQLWS